MKHSTSSKPGDHAAEASTARRLPTRIVLMADSAALPRGESWGNIPFEATYPYLLDQVLRDHLGREAPLLIERGMRYRTMEDVLHDWHVEIELKRPEVVILQVGGSDCAPRVFSRRQRELIEKLPPEYRARVLSLERKYRRVLISLFPSRVYVSFNRFKQNVDNIVRLARQSKLLRLIIVNIIPISRSLEYHLPGVTRNVERYNKVFDGYRGDSFVTVIDLNRQMCEWGGPDELTIDGMHMNRRGQALLARELASHVLSLFGTELKSKKG